MSHNFMTRRAVWKLAVKYVMGYAAISALIAVLGYPDHNPSAWIASLVMYTVGVLSFARAITWRLPR